MPNYYLKRGNVNTIISYLRSLRRARKLKKIKLRRFAEFRETFWQTNLNFHLDRIDDLSTTRKKESHKVCFILAFMFAVTLTAALGTVGLLALFISYFLGVAGLTWFGSGVESAHWLLKLHKKKVSEINNNNSLRETSASSIPALSGDEHPLTLGKEFAAQLELQHAEDKYNRSLAQAETHTFDRQY